MLRKGTRRTPITRWTVVVGVVALTPWRRRVVVADTTTRTSNRTVQIRTNHRQRRTNHLSQRIAVGQSHRELLPVKPTLLAGNANPKGGRVTLDRKTTGPCGTAVVGIGVDATTVGARLFSLIGLAERVVGQSVGHRISTIHAQRDLWKRTLVR